MIPVLGGELGQVDAVPQRCGGVRNSQTPQGTAGTWAQFEGGKGGGGRHAARGAETSGGGWRVAGAGAGSLQVGGA